MEKGDFYLILAILFVFVFIVGCMFYEVKKIELVETLVNSKYDYDIHLLLGDF